MLLLVLLPLPAREKTPRPRISGLHRNVSNLTCIKKTSKNPLDVLILVVTGTGCDIRILTILADTLAGYHAVQR